MKTPRESVEAVWHRPAEYDPERDGPPYLPRRVGTTKEAAYYDTQPTTDALEKKVVLPLTPLAEVLGLLQGAAMVHQINHWNTRGGSSYGDHLMFQRLYEDTLPFIDQVAERAVGSGDVQRIDMSEQIQRMAQLAALYGAPKEADQMVWGSLTAVDSCLSKVRQAASALKAEGKYSSGTANLLEGLADKLEEFQYLLKQRVPVAYDYDRA